MKKLGVVVLLVLSGCASSKPEMSEARRHELAQAWVKVNQCISDGNMSPEYGALGKQYLHDMLGNYTHDHLQLQATVAEITASGIQTTPAECNQYAVGIAERRNRLQRERKRSDQVYQGLQSLSKEMPKPVTCTTVGYTTNCR